MIRTSSAAAYRELIQSGTQCRINALIMATVADCDKEGATRKELAVALGLESNQVSGRVRELVKSDRLIEGKHKRFCRVTGNLVTYLLPVEGGA
jgi:hypothetical protein